MNLIEKYRDQAELAFAAYSTLYSGISGNEYRRALEDDGKGMASPQASAFSANWRVVEQYNDTDTGLSATVFQEIATGKSYLAVRGSEPSDFLNDILTADGGILLHGIPDLSGQYRSLYAKVADWQASGVLSGSFTVAGHSLGGWLAQGLAVDLGASVEHAYVYNAPGVFGGIFGDALQRLNAALGTTFLDPPSLSNVTNLRAGEGSSFIAGLGQALSSPIGILIEDQTRSDISDPAGSRNHSQRVLVDSLALYALFSRIDPTASLESITKIIESASANNGNTLESALDSLRTLFQQNYQYGNLDYEAVPTPSSGTATSRDVYYANLQSIQRWWDASPFTALGKR
jgi:pimeloyl-ACP methyl ester carboxylesterase